MVSYTEGKKYPVSLPEVLILIVVDDGLVHHSAMTAAQIEAVLILIVVDDGLVQFILLIQIITIMKSLNPYCSGRWSRTYVPHYG